MQRVEVRHTQRGQRALIHPSNSHPSEFQVMPTIDCSNQWECSAGNDENHPPSFNDLNFNTWEHLATVSTGRLQEATDVSSSVKPAVGNRDPGLFTS